MKHRFRIASVILLAITAPAARSQTSVSVQIGSPRQGIDGFGASSAWTAQNITDAQADLFFSTTSGLGLSLLRVRIAPSGNTWETATAQKAVARGARVWATPWSPPGAWKSNGTDNNGGTLLPDYHDDWAARLAQFVVNMRNAGVPILALSAQNEPNWTAEWETCRWTPSELTAFIRDHLGPALVARGVTARVLAPETIDWFTIDDYADNLLADPVARGFVSHIATHSYGGSAYAYAAPAQAGLPFWQTEYSDNAVASDPGMTSALRVAGVIHDFLTVAEGNAWHYWWMYPSGTNASSTGALVEAGEMTKRGWALGNWARFVRPGARRVAASGSTSTLRISAFTHPGSRRLSVVVVNSATSARTLSVTISGGAAPALVPWETSATRSLASLAAVAPNASGVFSLNAPAQSVTTYVTDSLNRPPVSLALSTSAILETAPAGTAIGRPVATDPDPDETYTFAFASGAGDTDNALFTLSGGFLRSAAPLDFEAGATRTVRLRVTDAAGLSLEQPLAITVVNNPNEYADWAATLPADSRAPAADANGDGLANLLAYALGLAANAVASAASATAASAMAPEAGAWRYAFELPASPPPDVRYAIEFSDDLALWRTLATKTGAAAWSGPENVRVGGGSSASRASHSVAAQAASRGFYRLRISLAN